MVRAMMPRTTRCPMVERPFGRPVGPGNVLPDASLDAVIAHVPESRLPEDLRIDHRPETRIRHSRGQSLPDWLAVRSGGISGVYRWVAFPKTKEEIQSIMAWAEREGWTLITYEADIGRGSLTPQMQDKPVLTISLAQMNRLLLDPTSQLPPLVPALPVRMWRPN